MEFNLDSSFQRNMDSIPFSWNESDDESTETAVQVTSSQLNRLTKFGVFLWWSDQTPPWVHPDDVSIASRLVPGNRVFRREECDNASDRKLGYSLFMYGQECFRGKPALWLEVNDHGVEIGDLIEIKSQSGKLRSQIAFVSAIVWNRTSRMIEYFVSVNGAPIQRPLDRSDFRPAIRLGKHLSRREIGLAARHYSDGESSTSPGNINRVDSTADASEP